MMNRIFPAAFLAAVTCVAVGECSFKGNEWKYPQANFHLKEKTEWAEEGYEGAWGQLPFLFSAGPERRNNDIGAENVAPPLSLDDTSDEVIVQGQGFLLTVSRRTGTISRLTYGTKPVIADEQGIVHGPRANAFRAFADNNRRMRDSFYRSGLTQLRYHPLPVKAELLDGGAVARITVTVNADGAKSARFLHETEFLVRADGVIRVNNQITPLGSNLPALPCLGVRMMLNSRLENFAWFGRGPNEDSVDRKTASDIGYYESTVTDQSVAYVRPQENGCKCDVRWAAFLDGAGDGVLFTFSQPLFVTAEHFTSEDLEFQRHRNGQERIYAPRAPRPEVCLSLDIAQTGLGNASCGPVPLKQYWVKPKPREYSYTMRPCQRGYETLSELARQAKREERP